MDEQLEESVDMPETESVPEETSSREDGAADDKCLLGEIHDTLAALERRFGLKMQYDEKKQKIIDAQHEELQELRKRLDGAILETVLMSIIRVIDAIESETARLRNPDKPVSAEEILSFTESLKEDLLDILFDNRIEPFRSNSGEAFMPLRHFAGNVVDTDDPEKNKTVGSSERTGYSTNKGDVFRKELVSVFKCGRAN